MTPIYINYNIFTALLISLGSLAVAWRLLKKKGNYYALFFGGIWVGSFVSYFFVVLMDYNYYLNFSWPAPYILGIMQFFVALIGFFMFAFLLMSITKKIVLTKKLLYFLFGPLMFFVFLILSFTQWQGPYISSWGVKYLPARLAGIIFDLIVAVLVILLIYSLVRLIKIYLKNKNYFYRNLIFCHISLSAFLATGIIDELGLAIGWSMQFFRMVMVIAIFMAYFCWPGEVKIENEERK